MMHVSLCRRGAASPAAGLTRLSLIALSSIALQIAAPTALSAAEPDGTADPLARQIARARDLLESRLTADAISAFRRADELAGGRSVEALVGLAHAYHQLGASSTAEKAALRAVEAAGEDPELRRQAEEALRRVRGEGETGRGSAEDGSGAGAGSNRLVMTTLDGRTLTLERFAGRAVLLDFWGTASPPCRQATPELGRLAGELEGEPFELVGVSGDPRGELEVYLAQNDVDWTQVWDPGGRITRGHFRVGRFPTYVLLDHEGREVYRVSGWSARIRRRLEARVAAAVRAAREEAERSDSRRRIR